MSHPLDAARIRRGRLVAEANPRPGLDYLVTLTGSIANSVAPIVVRMRYVPDRHIVTADVLAEYLGALAGEAWSGLEALGATVVDDIDSEVLPRWVQVILETQGRRVTFEQRKPDWENRLLLVRIGLD
jgi:hypothetical protein